MVQGADFSRLIMSACESVGCLIFASNERAASSALMRTLTVTGSSERPAASMVTVSKATDQDDSAVKRSGMKPGWKTFARAARSAARAGVP